MFTRHVIVRLRPKAAPEFTRLIEKEVIPMLRKQKGFLDEVTFISPDLTEAVGRGLQPHRLPRGNEIPVASCRRNTNGGNRGGFQFDVPQDRRCSSGLSG